MKKIVLLLMLFLSTKISIGQAPNPCNPDPLIGTKALQPGQAHSLITYKIIHNFVLYPSFNWSPKVYLVSFNHVWVSEPSPFCKNFKVKPSAQPGTFKPYGKDTIIAGIPYNNDAKVDTIVTWIANTGYNRVDSAFSNSCVSRAKATTCITVDSVKSSSVSGVLKSYGFAQAINPPVNSAAYAFSWSGVTVEDGQPLKQGDIGWSPVIEMGKTGKSRNIRQKAGSNDPITFHVHDYTGNFDTSGTLLSIVMRNQMKDDTLNVLNYWENDTVHIESDSLLFKVEFPSPFTASQGFIYLWVQNGLVIQSQKTGVFNTVPLPSPGTPVPFSFPFDNLINFHYNLDTSGLFNNDSIRVRLFMDGNNENHEIRTYDTNQVIPSILRPSCAGGSNGAITLYINFGVPPFTYIWNTGATTKDISGIPAGTYIVTVMDSIGTFATRTIIVTDPPLLFITGTSSNLTCYGALNGSISLVATGGTPGYSFLWNDGSTKTSRNALSAGTYTITVTDSKGCTSSVSFTLTQPPALTVVQNQTNVKCNGQCNGIAKLTGYGGTPPYVYAWSNGATTNKIISLCAGTYVGTITDANGCSKVKTFVITQPAPILLSATKTGPNEGTALVTGGTPSYIFKWFTVPVQTTATATGLIGGNVYKIKVTDANACTATIFFTFPISRMENPGAALENIVQINPNPCADNLNFSFKNAPTEGCKIDILDAMGRRVISYKAWRKDESIDMSGFDDGIYFIKLMLNNQVVVRKVVKNSRR